MLHNAYNDSRQTILFLWLSFCFSVGNQIIIRMRRIATTCCFLLSIAAANGEEKVPRRDTINTDRPDQTESPHIVSKGKLQLETGFSVNPFDSSDGSTPLIGIAVLRYGITERLEIRAMVDEGRNRDRYIEETTQGIYPLAIGAKALLLEKENGPIPQIALLGWLKLPFTSRSSEQSIYWSPQLLLAFENKIGEKLELEYNIGVKQEAYAKEWQEMASLSAHIEITDKLKAFVEYFGHYQKEEAPIHNADLGLIYLIHPGLQLDLAAGRSISAPHEKSNSFGSIGCSLRLPD